MKAFNAILLSLFLVVVGLFIGFKLYGEDVLPSADVKACVAELKSHMNRPLSFERKFGTTKVEPYAMYNVSFEYTAKNGFGNVIPGRAECWVDDGEVKNIKNFD